jgi:hypothetical protein
MRVIVFFALVATALSWAESPVPEFGKPVPILRERSWKAVERWSVMNAELSAWMGRFVIEEAGVNADNCLWSAQFRIVFEEQTLWITGPNETKSSRQVVGFPRGRGLSDISDGLVFLMRQLSFNTTSRCEPGRWYTIGGTGPLGTFCTVTISWEDTKSDVISGVEKNNDQWPMRSNP